MEIPKPTDEDKAGFLASVPDRLDVVVKPMFGNLGTYVNGNMLTGPFGPAIDVKLNKSDREALLSIDGAGPFGPPERPMGGYVCLPESWRTPSKHTERWVSRSLDFVADLPPKAPKKAKTPKAT